MDTTSTIKPALSSIEQLFSDSFSVFKKSVLKLFLLYLATYLIFAAIVIILALLFGGAFLVSGILKDPSTILASLGSIGIIAVIAVILGLLIGSVMGIASIKIADGADLGSAIRSSFPLIIPFGITTFISGILIAGGIFLFIIPGIALAILFSFVSFEVGLGNSSYLLSLRKSIYYASKNFWGIFLRYAIITAFIMIINFGIGLLFGNKNPAGSILNFIIGTVFGWFSLCYNLTIYKQASAGIENSQGKLTWAVIIGILGWIIGILIIFAVITFISQIPQSPT